MFCWERRGLRHSCWISKIFRQVCLAFRIASPDDLKIGRFFAAGTWNNIQLISRNFLQSIFSRNSFLTSPPPLPPIRNFVCGNSPPPPPPPASVCKCYRLLRFGCSTATTCCWWAKMSLRFVQPRLRGRNGQRGTACLIVTTWRRLCSRMT